MNFELISWKHRGGEWTGWCIAGHQMIVNCQHIAAVGRKKPRYLTVNQAMSFVNSRERENWCRVRDSGEASPRLLSIIWRFVFRQGKFRLEWEKRWSNIMLRGNREFILQKQMKYLGLFILAKWRLREDKIVLCKYTSEKSKGNGEELFKIKANFGSRTNGSNHCE